MADYHTQGSFAFTCNHAEMALIEEAFQASCDLQDRNGQSAPSPEFIAAFPPVTPDAPWSGFLAIFPDPDFPNFGVEFEGGNTLDRPEVSTVHLYSTTDFQPDALAHLIQHCCQCRPRSASSGPVAAHVPGSANFPAVGARSLPIGSRSRRPARRFPARSRAGSSDGRRPLPG